MLCKLARLSRLYDAISACICLRTAPISIATSFSCISSILSVASSLSASLNILHALHNDLHELDTAAIRGRVCARSTSLSSVYIALSPYSLIALAFSANSTHPQFFGIYTLLHRILLTSVSALASTQVVWPEFRKELRRDTLMSDDHRI